MAESGIELVTAWIRLVPTTEGINDNIADALSGATGTAADAGDKAGSAWSKGMKGALAVAGLTGAAVAVTKGLYEVGATFDDLGDTIRVGTGATGEALDSLVDSAKAVGQTVPVEFDKIGPTVADLNTRLGLTGDTLETVASQYLQAGSILGSDVDIQATSAAFSAFKVEGEGVVGAMDSLFRVSQATGVGMNELASGAQATAPAMQNLGFTFEDSIALIGTLDKAGINSTAVMASMSKGMVTLARDGEEPAAAFQRVTGEIQGYVDAGDTASALDLASSVFGTKGAAQFVGALQSGVVNLNDLMGATGATGDTILGAAEDTADFAEKWQLFVNQAMVAIEPLASAVFGALSDGMNLVLPAMQAFGQWAAENPALVQGVAIALGVLAVAIGVAAAAQWVMNAALFANPITWIIIAVVALVAAVVALAMNWDTVVAWISDVWGGFVTWLTDGLNGLATWWNDIWGGIAGAWESFWGETIPGVVQGAWNAVLGLIEGGVNGAIDLINGILGGVNSVGAAFGVSIDLIPSISLPRLADGATILPRPGGTAAILAEAGRPETVVDTGLLNRALQEGLEGTEKRSGREGPLVVVNPGPGMDEAVIGTVAAEHADFLDRQVVV